MFTWEYPQRDFPSYLFGLGSDHTGKIGSGIIARRLAGNRVISVTNGEHRRRTKLYVRARHRQYAVDRPHCHNRWRIC